MENFYFETIMVHGSVFHADDVCCVALSKILNPWIKVERVLKVPEEIPETTIVCDIGGGEFDHHQEQEYRENGVPYASFGKMWREYGELLLPDESSWRKFDEMFVQPIDSADNGVSPNLLSATIHDMNPSFTEDGSPEARDRRFNKAVEFMIPLIQRKIKLLRDAEEARKEVQSAVEDVGIRKYVVLDKFLPWQEVVVPTDNLLVIFPSNRGGYNIQAVPVEKGSFETRLNLNDGVTDEVKEKYGITFVHPSGFLASTDTLDGAISFAAYQITGIFH